MKNKTMSSFKDLKVAIQKRKATLLKKGPVRGPKAVSTDEQLKQMRQARHDHPDNPNNKVQDEETLVSMAGEMWADENLGGNGNGDILFHQDSDPDWNRAADAELREWRKCAREVILRVQKAKDPLTMNSMEKHFLTQKPKKEASTKRSS